MRNFARLAISIGAAALFAGCSGSQPPIAASRALLQNSAPAERSDNNKYEVLYSFGALPDGNYPHSALVGAGGTFYGTTFAGGANYCGSNTCGTVFSISGDGAEKVLHNFGSGTDGFSPFAGLIHVGDTLYGTTGNGGAYDSGTGGTVFSITTNGTEKVLHSFGSGTDGSGPTAGLVNVKGTLYGTTSAGGTHNAGTVFSITTDGTEKVLYNFTGGADGDIPQAGLVEARGKLYGTTFIGGANGHGTVFSITKRGSEKVLHSFGATRIDGTGPEASLIDDGSGLLYGTTLAGGSGKCPGGCGTVFRVTTWGSEETLYDFRGGYYGASPGGLTSVQGTLYGTTAIGGGPQNGGTVFGITGSRLKVLHRFGKGADGSDPAAAMDYERGTLVGTTYHGGAYGVGTVFSLTPLAMKPRS
jgi:uncharacterized repeat protein (TIGR03803 family)